MKTSKRFFSIVAVLPLIIGLASCKKDKVEPPVVKIFSSYILTNTTANVKGEVTDEGGAAVTDRGFFYSKQGGKADTVYSGGGKGVFSSEITGLEPNTTYTCGAFARNIGGTAFSDKITFTTRSYAIATVTTNEVTQITATSAIGGGKVTAGGATVTERGICWATTQNPTVSNTHQSSGTGTGAFTVNMTGLTANTTYHVRAYAVHSQGTAYGNDVTLKTLELSAPAVTTISATNIKATTAQCGGEVTVDGGATVTERGICWATTQNPTMSNTHQSSGTGTGAFTVNMTGLTPNTTYHVRAYAVNNQGTAYGNDVTLKTLELSTPAVTTISATNITATTAQCGGEVTADGGDEVTARGVCYGTSQNPTISGNHTTNGTGTGSFTSSLTGLTANTKYYVRAYATNSKGTAYGEQKTFTTLQYPIGAINGKYSVSGSKRVYFSMGNLQYQASTHTWRFAESQLDYTGSHNANISSYYNGWIDLFGWGTGNNPTNRSTSNSSYSSFTDWGTKPISNGGNQANQWRTLTYDEWNFLMFNRSTSSGIRYAKATVNGVTGVIILPDDWSTSYYTLSSTNSTGAAYSANTITSANWASKFEAHGAVFLPAAGLRNGSSVGSMGTFGDYWSSTPNGSGFAYGLYFGGGDLGMRDFYRYCGFSVRLVAEE